MYSVYQQQFRISIFRLMNFVGFALSDTQDNKKILAEHREYMSTFEMQEIYYEEGEEKRKNVPFSEKEPLIKSIDDQIVDQEHYFEFIKNQSIIFSKSLFDQYIMDVLHYIYSKHTKILSKKRPNEQAKSLEYSDILEYTNYDDLIHHIIDKELYYVGQLSFPKLIKYFEKVMGTKLTLDEDYEKSIIMIFIIRNLIVHNGGIADEKLIACSHHDTFTLNEPIQISHQRILSYFMVILRVVSDIDKQLYRKFFLS